MNREELAWAAGFFDGEGSFSFHLSASGRSIAPRKTISAKISAGIWQADGDTLQRFRRAVLNIGSITGPYAPRKPTHQPMYHYNCGGWRQAQALFAMLWFRLSEPKRKQWRRCFEQFLAAYPDRGQPNARLGAVEKAWRRRRELYGPTGHRLFHGDGRIAT